MQKLFENWRIFTEQERGPWDAIELPGSGREEDWSADSPISICEKGNCGFILGDLESGEILKAENEDQLFYGASMNKPLIALAHLIKYRNIPGKMMTKRELKGLLAYRGYGRYESNNINRLISGVYPRKPDLAKSIRIYGPEKGPKRFKKDTDIYNSLITRRQAIGRISTNKEAAAFLTHHGLSSDIKIRYGSNVQSPKAFFEFIKFLHKAERISGIEEEVNIILNHMKREPLGLDRSDRESQRWKWYQQKLAEKGLNVTSIYGKGGRTPIGRPKAALNYGFVINNELILVIYTEIDDHNHMANLMASVLKGKL